MDWSDYEGSELLKADGLDDAIIGIGSRCGQPEILAYDVSKVIVILMQRDNMTELQAVEFFEFNIQGSWMGEKTPIWIHPLAD